MRWWVPSPFTMRPVLLLFYFLSSSSPTEDCLLRHDCHLHFNGRASSSSPVTDPEPKRVSAAWLKTRKGEWTTRKGGEVPAQLVTAWEQSTEAWCANCTHKERSLDKYYRYEHGTQDLDIAKFPIVDRLKVLANQHVLFLGDSLMRQVFYSLFWIFPGSSKRPSKPRGLDKYAVCGVDTNDIDFSIYVTRLDLTVHYCYNTYLGEHLNNTIDMLFLKKHFNYTIINSGLWYNRINMTEAEDSRIRGIKRKAKEFKKWAPLSESAYENDLKLLDIQIKKHSLKHGDDTSYMMWMESSPQHFRTGTFHQSDLHREGKQSCKQFDDEELEASLWRNKLSERYLSLPVIHTFLPLASLYYSHPRNRAGIPDCTHFCNPGLAPLFLATRVLTNIVTREIWELAGGDLYDDNNDNNNNTGRDVNSN